MKDKQEMESLKGIVEKAFDVNIMKKNREREIVEARMVYAKILRDRGYSYKSIAVSLKKDHTTVIHYVQVIGFILTQDSRLLQRYVECKKEFMIDKEDFIAFKLTEKELGSRIEELTNKVDSLLLERDEIIKIKKSNARLEIIIDMLKENIKEGQEKFYERKLNQIFNED
jgi:hypothetical protein